MKSISSAIIALAGVGLVAAAPLYEEMDQNLTAAFMLSGIAIGLVGFVNWFRSLKSD